MQKVNLKYMNRFIMFIKLFRTYFFYRYPTIQTSWRILTAIIYFGLFFLDQTIRIDCGTKGKSE